MKFCKSHGSKYFYIITVISISCVATLWSSPIYAQPERKNMIALRISSTPTIDGSLSETDWQRAIPASNFYQYDPYNDRPASFDTYVWVLYDDNYLYIGARMLDPNPEKILAELSLRDADDELNADKFGIDFNPFDDGIYAFSFRISASNVQSDINISHGTGWGGDYNWNAVWTSATSITDQGWEAEIRIPYSALRFPPGMEQEWGINFWREIRRKRELSSWNFVDRTIGNTVASMGLLLGITDIAPPLRLSLFPYMSGYIETDGTGEGWKGIFNSGMDLKWGINESFTVDMTLIPDFGQVQTDDRILNLSPFEVRYDENRQFFTEGTELFNKGHLFYSRRIGARPSGYNKTESATLEGEIVVTNPIETRLINATKLTGRTIGGLGIGVLNAMTAPGKAILKDTVTGLNREFVTQPFTNYNIIVVDQSLPNNSFISFINTNVLGIREGYTGNVTGTDFRFMDQTGMFRIAGEAALSQQYYINYDDIFGYKYTIRAGKFGGLWQYHYGREVISNTYFQNDMGFLRRNNLITDNISFSLNIYEPFWRLLNLHTSFSASYNRLYKEGDFSSVNLSYLLRFHTESRNMLFFRVAFQPFGSIDHHEPRVAGRFFERGGDLDFYIRGATNSQRRFFIDADAHFRNTLSQYDQFGYSFDIGPFFRASDRVRLGFETEWEFDINNIGYVDHTDANNIFFGMRDIRTIENEFEFTGIISNNFSFDMNLRHYWTLVNYTDRYFWLQPDGLLRELDNHTPTPDINYNAFNFDARLTWNFAPGSQMTLMWRNIIDSEKNELIYNYLDNLQVFLDEPQTNSISLKILYYLDYQTLFNRRG